MKRWRRMRLLRISLVTVLAVALLMTLSVSALAKTTITFSMRASSPERHPIFDGWAERYSELNPDVEVQVLKIAGNYYETLLTIIVAGTPVDVMWMGTDFYGMYDYLLPLDDLWEKDPAIRDIHEGALTTARWEGRLLTIPFGINTHTVFFNKDMMNEAGVVPPHDGWTWDDALEIGRALTRDFSGDGVPDQWGLQMYYPHMAWGYGGSLFSNDGRTMRLDDPVRMAGLRIWADMRSGRIESHLTAGDSLQNALAGRVGMVHRGIFDVPKFRESAQFDWDVVGMPTLEHEGVRSRTTFMSPEAWAIAASSPNIEVAKDFVRFIMQPEQALEFHALGAVIPTQAQMARETFLGITPPDNLVAFIEAMEYAGDQFWAHPAYSDYSSALISGPVVTQMWQGSIPVEVAVPEIQRMANAAIAEFFERQAER